MANSKTLIITGWNSHHVYAHAAALALLRYPKAEIKGASRARLVETLKLAHSFKEILILGAALDGAPVKLAEVVRELVNNGVTLRWISGFPAPDSIDRETVDALSPYIADSLEEAVIEALEIHEKDLWESIQTHAPLLEAAGYAHRSLDSDHFYASAIYYVAQRAGRDAWTNEERLLVQQHKFLSDVPLIGSSAQMRKLRSTLKQLAEHPYTRVMLLGESGTGKEAAALMIHYLSQRRESEFVPFNCASSNPQLLESSFRGHLKGAFTGANRDTPGVFKRADGGTLFLDEVGELPLESQAVLLRILEDGVVVPIGGEGSKQHKHTVDVRVVAATNRDLAQMVKERTFREDLYYRLSTITVRMPALREHLTDLPQICQELWGRVERKGWRRLSKKQVHALNNYEYPGNVRELANLLERAYVLNIQDFDRLLSEYKYDMGESLNSATLPDPLEEVKRMHINNVLAKYDNNIARAAAALKISRNTAVKYSR